MCNADWYRLSYTRAAVQLNRALGNDAKDDAKKRDAKGGREGARRTLLAAEDVRRHLSDKHDADLERLVRLLAQVIEPSAMVLLAGAMIALDEPWSGKALDKRPAIDKWRTSLISRLREEDVPDPLASEWTEYVAALPRVPYRAVYNLACLWTQMGRYDDADRDLRTALAKPSARERRRLARQALADPSLRPLLTHSVDLNTHVRRLARDAPTRDRASHEGLASGGPGHRPGP